MGPSTGRPTVSFRLTRNGRLVGSGAERRGQGINDSGANGLQGAHQDHTKK